MDKLAGLYQPTKPHIFVLMVVMALFIIFRVEVPRNIAGLVDSIVGRVVLGLLVVFMFITNKILGILGIVTYFVLLSRSTQTTGTHAVNNYLPSQRVHDREMSAFNQFPETLEEEIVQKLVPFGGEADYCQPTYKPTLSEIHEASIL